MSEPTIIKASIEHSPFGYSTVSAMLDTGASEDLFNFYRDEISFSEIEFLGKTTTQARALRHQRDVAYLQS